MVPTFLGSTVLVFVILQIAPGGPIEKAIMELQMGGMEDGGSGGNFSQLLFLPAWHGASKKGCCRSGLSKSGACRLWQ